MVGHKPSRKTVRLSTRGWLASVDVNRSLERLERGVSGLDGLLSGSYVPVGNRVSLPGRRRFRLVPLPEVCLRSGGLPAFPAREAASSGRWQPARWEELLALVATYPDLVAKEGRIVALGSEYACDEGGAWGPVWKTLVPCWENGRFSALNVFYPDSSEGFRPDDRLLAVRP